MDSGKEFLFVNTSDNPSARRRGSGLVRAFLMRNICANQEWPKRKASRTMDREDDAPGSLNLESSLHFTPTEQSVSLSCCDGWTLEDSEAQTVFRDHTAPPSPGEQPSALCGQSQWHCGMFHDRRYCICAKCHNRQYYIRKSPVDPFESLAVPLDAEVGNLLVYFMDVISPEMTPITGKIRVTQIHRDWLSSWPQRRDYYSGLSLHHKVRAIAAVQHNLRNPNLAISDENIAAVFNILCVEENMFLPVFITGSLIINPDVKQRQAHMQGLKDMIHLRGGIHGLGSFKPLQHFIIRHTVPQAAISFQSANLLPPDLIDQLYHDYPRSSRFYGEPGPMFRQSSRIGVDSKLLDLICTMECLLQDTNAWFEAPDRHNFDILDLNTLYSTIISMIVRWYLDTEREGRLKSVDAILGLSLMQFTAFLCRSTCPAYSGPMSVLERLKQHLFCHYDENMAILYATNLDVWVGLLAVLSSDGIWGYKDVFWNVYMDIVVKKSATLRSFEDLQTFLTTHCLWSPYPMDVHAKNIWDETPLVWGNQNDGSLEPSQTRIQSQRTIKLAAVLISSNPYLGGNPMGQIPLDSEQSPESF